MATVVALAVDFQFGSNSTPTSKVDRSSYVKSIDMSRMQDLPEITNFNVTAKTYAAGLMDNTFDVEFFWDTTIDTHVNALIGYTTAVDFLYGPDGTTTGKRKFTGTFFVKDVKHNNKVGEVKTFTATFQSSGALTTTVY